MISGRGWRVWGKSPGESYLKFTNVHVVILLYFTATIFNFYDQGLPVLYSIGKGGGMVSLAYLTA